MEKTRTMVKICGKEYMMAGYESEEYIHRVAIYVDRKMTDLKSKYVNLNPNTLSVLTAINVADDLLKLQDQFDALSEEYQGLAEEVKKIKIEMSLGKDGRPSNVSSIKKQGKNQLFDGYK
ncbi:MAG: cell division protein ZapA [Eubacteriales bacterium]|nr:cell division protein ZapA [Eubacteriales bacterium]